MNGEIMDNSVMEITQEHAVVITPLHNLKSLMPYLEAVAVVIGSCHIHSIYESQDNVKVYLNDKKFVDILVNNGICIQGRHVNVEYAVPRSDKVMLSNVDPILPDSALVRVLSFFGVLTSSVIHEKVSTHAEYSHIECGSRKVYMDIFSNKKIPTRINLTYQGVCYHINAAVERYVAASNSPLHLTNTSDSLYDATMRDSIEDVGVGTNLNVKPLVDDDHNKISTPKPMSQGRRRKNAEITASLVANKIKRKAAKGIWFGTKNRRVKRMRVQQNNGIGRKPREVSAKGLSAKNALKSDSVDFIKARRSRTTAQEVSSTEPAVVQLDNASGELTETSVAAIDQSSNSSFSSQMSGTLTQFPLTTDELKKFLFKTKFNHKPTQVAVEMLAEKKITDGVESLIAQLKEYVLLVKEVALKHRVKRLISVLGAPSEDQVD